MSVADTYSNYSDKWFTPTEWLGWACRTIGDHYFDPCPEDPTRDGLEMIWPDYPRYVNHPGGRGNFTKWYNKFMVGATVNPSIWCGFSLSQLRLSLNEHRSFFEVPGYLILPSKRISYIWGGQDGFKGRKKGEPMKSPSSDSFFWSSVKPAQGPVPCQVIATGTSAWRY